MTQNDPSLIELSLDNSNIYGDDGQFHSDIGDDYSTLGVAIADNTHLKTLDVMSSNDIPLTVSDREFYDGLKSNSSISNLSLYCNYITIAGGVAQEILQTYSTGFRYNRRTTIANR